MTQAPSSPMSGLRQWRSTLLHAPAVATWRTMTRSVGILYIAAGGIGVVPTSSISATANALVMTASAISLLLGVALLLYGRRFPRKSFHVLIQFSVALLTLCVLVSEATEDAATYVFLYTFAIAAAAFFASWLGFFVHLALALLASTLSLAHIGVDDGHILVWAVAMAGLGVLMSYLVRLADRAEVDPLTGLANRRALSRALDESIGGAGRHDGLLALAIVDLDRFKTHNDTLGHLAGDDLLLACAQRWQEVVPPAGLLARLGGDEFAVLLPAHTPTAAAEIADLMRQGLPAGATASAGVAAWQHGDTSTTLMSRADVALYEAKSAGRDQTVIYGDPDRATRQLELAIADQQLVMHYQPIVRLADRAVVSYEALVRWEHPEDGMVWPDAFVPAAERTGAIHPLGAWTFDQACRTAAALPEEVTVSVNVSINELRQPGYAAVVAERLAACPMPRGKLVIEVTEAVYDDEDSQVIATLQELRRLGVKIAIDDFGSGYSSLRWLSKYPFDILKIDGAFVRDVDDRTAETPILQSIIELGQRLGVVVVAEQVETEHQARLLDLLGCERAQGFHFGRPEPLEITPPPTSR